jgi:hypothetical protein
MLEKAILFFGKGPSECQIFVRNFSFLDATEAENNRQTDDDSGINLSFESIANLFVINVVIVINVVLVINVVNKF